MRHSDTPSLILPTGGRLEAQPHPLVEMRGISKYFGKLRANYNINLRIYPGRIKALLGENGAGKSTLMSILAGRLQPDDGTLLVQGRATRLRDPKDAHAAGIGMVYQHFMLVDSMTVAENVLLGHGTDFMLRPARMRARVAELAGRYGLGVDPAARICELSMGERQRVEIIKLLCRQSQVLIFDEPTAVLTPKEADLLFDAMRLMAGQGKSIVFISHKLPEVLAVSDEVAILRRGEIVDEFDRKSVPDEAELARRMLGRDLRRGAAPQAAAAPDMAESSLQAANAAANGAQPQTAQPDAGKAEFAESYSSDKDHNGEENQLRLAMGKLPFNLGPGRKSRMDLNSTVLECAGVHYGPLKDINFKVLKGDILAVVGVAGNGQRELVELICGGKKPDAGNVRILEQESREFFRRRSGRGGLAYIPEERKDVASCIGLDLTDNFLLTTYKLFSGRVLLERKRARRATEGLIADYGIYPPNSRAKAGELSGGNLQKLIVGRELMPNPACIVAENPTQGLDIAATEEVWQRLRVARESSGILLVTGDVTEALALADHIAVMYRGCIVDIFGSHNSAKVADIGLMMAGGKV